MSTEKATEPSLVAYRGDSRLTDDSLRAHLATILRLEHVGLLLGSGASVNVGGMTIAQLWNHFTTKYIASCEALKVHGFVEEDNIAPNLEQVMDQLQIACLEAERTQSSELEQLQSARLDLRRAVIHASILQENFWEEPSLTSEVPPVLQDHCRILQKLRGARQPGQPAPWIFTPNYDLAIEWAAEAVGLEVMNGFRGVHNRTFSPHAFDLGLRNTLARGEARFGCYEVYVAKLHGSLTWLTSDDRSVFERSAQSLWVSIKAFRDGNSDVFGQAMVFPSGAKYLQTVGFILGELFRRFNEFLNRPQTALIVNGYSFGDEHLNRILLSALQNPTLSLVIYAPMAKVTKEGVEVPDDRTALKRLANLKSPQVTIVGNNSRAYFSALANDLPDPAIFDERSAEIRRMLREMQENL